ncbi:MAG TPA: ferritin-like domain-containing protein [Abditibacteriaceae bacterium]|jgi:ferritin-like metal-binding protein YciE
MPLDTLENTLTHELSDLLSAENQFAKALLTVAKNADSDEVRVMAQEHHAETLQQIDNLKQAFTILGSKPERGLVCKAAQGLVEENSSTLKEEKPKGAIKDVVLLGGSLRIEHYEIAGYTAAISLAKSLGQKEVVRILQTNLAQEKATAKKVEAATPALLLAASATPVTAPAAAKPAAKKATASKATASKAAPKKTTKAK